MNGKIPYIAALLMIVSLSVLQAGGKPLSLVGSNPISGAVDVSVGITIELEFSNNVTNRIVQDVNGNAFNLAAEDGTAIPLTVLFPDDQLEPEKKRIISLDPKRDLDAGTHYILTISGALQSKNGSSLGIPVVIPFMTEK